jgi:hypothetical protein
MNVGVLTIMVAGSAALYAQDEKPREEERPPQQEEPRKEPKKEEMKAPKQDEMKPEKQEQEKVEKSDKQPKQDQREQKDQEKQTHEQMQMKDNKQEAQQVHGRPAGKSAHIPDDHFRSNFGHSHTFVVQRTTVVEGRPGFAYGGYSFVLVDAWPGDWSYTDDCYVDYVDGDYFLFNLLHPGIRIALFVVM